jgi:ADP-ribosylglycohydrolase
MSVSLASRVTGCLLGGAIGDALGAPIEFDSLATIRARFGERGVVDFVEEVGRVTDDTQMTLFTAEGILEARAGGTDPVVAVHRSYLRWLATQGFEHPLATLDGWLLRERLLWFRRAPGNTCLNALANANALGELATNDSKGCGTIMRVAPVGCVLELEPAFELGKQVSWLTHGHPSGYLAGAYFAALLSLLVRGAPLRSAIEAARAPLAKEPGAEEVERAIDQALAFPDDIEALGAGWVAEEALAIGLYAALASQSFEEAVLRAVNHGGDSDSTGLVAGNLMGALHGVEAIPARWLARVELAVVIERIANELCSHDQGQ